MSLRRAVTPLKLRDKEDVIVKRGGAKTQSRLELAISRVEIGVNPIVKKMQSITNTETECKVVLLKIRGIIDSINDIYPMIQALIVEKMKLVPGNEVPKKENNNVSSRIVFGPLEKQNLKAIQDTLFGILRKIQAEIETFKNTLNELQSKKLIVFDQERFRLNRPNSFNFSKATDAERVLTNFLNFLKTIRCYGQRSPYRETTSDIKPTIETFDTTLLETMDSLREFDTPEDVLAWFTEYEGMNYFMYLYGVGKILKTKQALLEKNSKSLGDQISKANRDYNSGIKQIGEVVPSLSAVDKDAAKKEKLIDEIVDTTNKSYTTQFNELLQKKIRYDETIKKIQNRRAYLVYQMNQPDEGFREIVIEKIMKRVNDLYEYYRGSRYKEIRKMIFSFVVICAYNPEIIEKSFILNTSITGPAGSGKTTMARKLAIWFTTIGFLTNDSFLDNEDLSYREVGAPQLIAQYVGQTAPMTQGVLYSSLEQCLFIDEAYSVAGCSFDSTGKLQASQYGEEFIAVLLPFMANHQGIGNIIVAGYKNLMESCFFERNEGLPRRFPTKIDLPLYTTDELYDMFLNFNIIKRQVASIKNPTTQVEFRRAKQIIYVGLKPAFLMFHYDTSFCAFEILRKYLLFMEIRKQQFAAASYPLPLPTHSYTIANHVLTNVLSSPLRRNIVRLYFYKEVFGFESQNLSWFPAQAGEMGLVADMVNRKIEVVMNEKKKNGEKQGYISIEQETDVFDTYFENKPVRITYFKDSKEGPVYVEVIKRGYEYEKEKFQEKINNIVIQPILQRVANFTKSAEEVKANKVLTEEEKETKRAQWIKNNPDVDPSTMPKEFLPNPEKSSATSAAADSTPDGRPRAPSENPQPPTPVAAPVVKKVTLPSLVELWKLLFEKSNEILLSAIDNYIQIADKVIPDLLKIPENKFPVNMLKTDVYNEEVLINFYKSAKRTGTISESGLYKSEFQSFYILKQKYIQEGNKITLQNPTLFRLLPETETEEDLSNQEVKKRNEARATQFAKNKEEAYWEDFAFKNKD